MAKKSALTFPKRRRLRLLPLTITMMALLFIVKMNELYIDSKPLREMYSAREAIAEDAKKPDAASTDAAAKTDGNTTAADASAPKDGAAATDKPAEGDNADKPDDKKDSGKKDGKKDKKPAEEMTYGTGKTSVKDIEAMKARDAQPRFTQSELDLLQNLSKRRDELDQREADLDIKEKALDASEKRLTDKIAEMKTLQVELSKVLAQYNEKQDGQIKSLVKIYENMKPEDAANIFNEMEMPILLDVIGKMSERKVALVLANMSPKKAKDVTQELADRRKKAAQSEAAAAEAAAPATPPSAPPAPPAAVAPTAAPAPTTKK